MKLNGQIDILNGQIESHQAAMAGVKLDLQVPRTAELCQPWLPVSIVHGYHALALHAMPSGMWLHCWPHLSWHRLSDPLRRVCTIRVHLGSLPHS